MKFRKFLLLPLFILLVVHPAKSNPEKKIINKVWKALGGKKNWEHSHYLSFIFEQEINNQVTISRSHYWDRKTGNYRLETTQKDGSELLVLFNINSKTGQAFINKTKVLSDSLNLHLIDKAFSFYINDSFWLLAPTMLDEPDIAIQKEMGIIINNKKYYCLKISPRSETAKMPIGQYWLFIDIRSGEIIRWNYLLKAQKGNAEVADWLPYKKIGDMKFSTEKIGVSGNFAIRFPAFKISSNMDENIFIHP